MTSRGFTYKSTTTQYSSDEETREAIVHLRELRRHAMALHHVYGSEWIEDLASVDRDDTQPVAVDVLDVVADVARVTDRAENELIEAEDDEKG